MKGLEFTEEEIISIINGIYLDIISASHLPKNLYSKTAHVLEEGLYKGFRKSLADFEFGTPDYKLLQELRTNIYLFSGAKTFTQVRDIGSLMYEGNKIVPLKDFKEKALDRFKVYNGNKGYLDSEYITALTSGESCAKWDDIIKTADVMPIVEYVAVMDDHTSPECASLNGLKLNFDDPKLNKITPPNHFRCRCLLLNHSKEDARVTTPERADKKYNSALDIMDDTFKMSPYHDREVFKTTGKGKHPYFIVPSQYKELAKKNFNLPIPGNGK